MNLLSGVICWSWVAITQNGFSLHLHKSATKICNPMCACLSIHQFEIAFISYNKYSMVRHSAAFFLLFATKNGINPWLFSMQNYYILCDFCILFAIYYNSLEIGGPFLHTIIRVVDFFFLELISLEIHFDGISHCMSWAQFHYI